MATSALHLDLRAAASAAAALSALLLVGSADARIAAGTGSDSGFVLRLPAPLPAREVAVPILMCGFVPPAYPEQTLGDGPAQRAVVGSALFL